MAKLKDRYANALIELSVENKSLEKDLELVVQVRDRLKEPDVQALINHPHVSKEDKFKIFDILLGENHSKHIRGLLHLVVDKGRESLIIPTLTEYVNRANRLLGRIEAELVSAKVLTEEEIESVRVLLSKKLGKEVKLNHRVDPDVIGGFYVLVDGHIFDCTVRTDLSNMKESLKRGSFE
jgi:F-type H+-transporting ATPase subunit delta